MDAGASIADIHEIALANWHSNSRGSDVRFIAAIDAIEARVSAEAFEAYRIAFPDCEAPDGKRLPADGQCLSLSCERGANNA